MLGQFVREKYAQLKQITARIFNKKGKIYHVCTTRNKNGKIKFIDFKRGELCMCPSSSSYWREDIKEKYMKTEPRRMTRQYAREYGLQYGPKAIDFKKL